MQPTARCPGNLSTIESAYRKRGLAAHRKLGAGERSLSQFLYLKRHMAPPPLFGCCQSVLLCYRLEPTLWVLPSMASRRRPIAAFGKRRACCHLAAFPAAAIASILSSPAMLSICNSMQISSSAK